MPFGGRKREAARERLLSTASRVIPNYSVTDEYLNDHLKPYLLDLYDAFVKDSFDQVDQIKAHSDLLQRLHPLNAALCATQVLSTAGTPISGAGPLGTSYCAFVAAQGMTGVHGCVQRVIDEKDSDVALLLMTALGTLWRYEPTPYNELDHAQAMYMEGQLRWRACSGVLADFKEGLQRALVLLEPIEPGGHADVAAHKEQLMQAWREQLQAVSGST